MARNKPILELNNGPYNFYQKIKFTLLWNSTFGILHWEPNRGTSIKTDKRIEQGIDVTGIKTSIEVEIKQLFIETTRSKDDVLLNFGYLNIT